MRNLNEAAQEITVAIHDSRQPHDVRCALLQSDTPFPAVQTSQLSPLFADLVREVGGEFEPQWELVSFEHARDSLELALRFDMAYGTQYVTASDASALANRFLAHFEGGQAFVAAYDLTDAMYQVTFIVVSQGMVGILYIEDED